MQELARLTKPKAIVGAGLLFRYQHVARQRDECPAPTRPSLTSTARDVREEARFGGVSMVVEDPVAAVDKHVISGVSGGGLYPDGLHLRPTPTFQEGVSKDVACATREEDAIWQGPSRLCVALAVPGGPRLIHRMRPAEIDSIAFNVADSDVPWDRAPRRRGFITDAPLNQLVHWTTVPHVWNYADHRRGDAGVLGSNP